MAHKRRFRSTRASAWTRGPHLARSGTSPQCVPTADSSRSIIYERRLSASSSTLPPHTPPGDSFQASGSRPVDAAGARKSRHLRDSRARYIEFGHGPPLAFGPDPDSARDTRSFEITMRQTAIRRGIEFRKDMWKVSWIFWNFSHFSFLLITGYSGIFNPFRNLSSNLRYMVQFF